MENWRRFLKEVEKIDLPAAEPYKDNWEDPPVAVVSKPEEKGGGVDADIESGNNSGNAHLFVLLIDKLAEYFQVPEPVITSAYRDAKSQRGAILGIWAPDPAGKHAARSGKLAALKGLKGEENPGSKYIMDMYQTCEDRGACLPGSGDLARRLVDRWENAQENAGGKAVDDETYQWTADEIEKNGGMSMHQTGDSVDYGIKSNDGAGHIWDMIEYALNYLVDGHPIDETEAPGPHYHITVHSITPEGMRFLETPNEEWDESENKSLGWKDKETEL